MQGRCTLNQSAAGAILIQPACSACDCGTALWRYSRMPRLDLASGTSSSCVGLDEPRVDIETVPRCSVRSRPDRHHVCWQHTSKKSMPCRGWRFIVVDSMRGNATA